MIVHLFSPSQGGHTHTMLDVPLAPLAEFIAAHGIKPNPQTFGVAEAVHRMRLGRRVARVGSRWRWYLGKDDFGDPYLRCCRDGDPKIGTQTIDKKGSMSVDDIAATDWYEVT